MLLVECNVLEQVKVINEGKEGNTRLRMQGKFQQCDEQNNNGRIYPKAILENQVKAIQEKIGDRSLVGALDHPSNDAIHLSQASHLITKLWLEKDGSVMGECEILSTPNGKIVEALINDGVKIGISSRGIGSVTEGIKGKIVNEDFKLITFDLVSDPSTRGAFPELSESMRENSQRAQEIVSKHKKDRVLLTMLENKITEAMKKKKKKYEEADDSGLGMLDGKPGVTRKDVLIGRGVLTKDGEETEKPAKKKAKKAKKAPREDSSTDVKAAVVEGFKRACWGDRYDEYSGQGVMAAAKKKSFGDEEGGVETQTAAQKRKGKSTSVTRGTRKFARGAGKPVTKTGTYVHRSGSTRFVPDKETENSSTTLDKFADVIRERCWKGYKPVKGKKPYSKGSCEKK